MARITLASGLSYQFIDPAFTAPQLAGINSLLAASLSAGPEHSALARWIGYQFGDPRISKASAAAKLPFGGGDPSPFFETLDNLTQEGAVVTRGNSYSDIATIDADLPAWLTADQMALIVGAGGDIADDQVFFELTSLAFAVPASFPQRLDANQQPLTWANWGTSGVNHQPVQLGGKWYRSNQYGAGGICLKASEWVPYLLAGGTVLTKFQYQAVLAAN